MILITCSTCWLEEKKYIIEVIFSQLLGLPYQLAVDGQSDDFIIELDNNRRLVIQGSLLVTANQNYLTEASLPIVSYVKNEFTPEKDLPLLFGCDVVDITDMGIVSGIDIFATGFFMLSRMEEAIINEKDNHGRFPAKASVAFKYNFLERPIIDEYVAMLRNMLLYLDPTLICKPQTAKNFVTCDLDWPFDPVRRGFKKTLLKSAADIVKRKSIKSGLLTWKYYIFHRLGIKQEDVYRESIDWIMDVNEQVGNKVAFYFIARSTSKLDTDFDFSSPEMIQLLQSIHARGHEIGLHPGYHCFDNEQHFIDSFKVLKEAMINAGVVQNEIGGRMHFLRWDILKTPQLWEQCGLDYDSTLSFADHTGFRCGTSHEFSMFDLVKRKQMKLKQRPLINMECTVIAPRYENLGYSAQSLSRFKHFKALTQQYTGCYTLLWHNSHFMTAADRQFYRELIK